MEGGREGEREPKSLFPRSDTRRRYGGRLLTIALEVVTVSRVQHNCITFGKTLLLKDDQTFT